MRPILCMLIAVALAGVASAEKVDECALDHEDALPLAVCSKTGGVNVNVGAEDRGARVTTDVTHPLFVVSVTGPEAGARAHAHVGDVDVLVHAGVRVPNVTIRGMAWACVVTSAEAVPALCERVPLDYPPVDDVPLAP